MSFASRSRPRSAGTDVADDGRAVAQLPSLQQLSRAPDDTPEATLPTGQTPCCAHVVHLALPKRPSTAPPAARRPDSARPPPPPPSSKASLPPCHVFVRVQDLLAALAQPMDDVALARECGVLAQSGKPRAPRPREGADARRRSQLASSDVVVLDGSMDWVVETLARTLRRMRDDALDSCVRDVEGKCVAEPAQWVCDLFRRSFVPTKGASRHEAGLAEQKPCLCWWLGGWHWCDRVLSASSLP